MLFNREVAIRGSRPQAPVALVVSACIVDDGVPLDAVEGQLSASLDRFCVFFKREDWTDVEPPHIGDSVIFADRTFRVATVTRLGECFALGVRSR